MDIIICGYCLKSIMGNTIWSHRYKHMNSGDKWQGPTLAEQGIKI